MHGIPGSTRRSGGDRNPDKTFYVIFRNHGGGMFSDVMHVMHQTKLALEHGMIPVVDLRLGRSVYNEKQHINGSDNPWEYYFEQPCGYSPEEAYQSKNIVVGSGEVLKFKEFYYSDAPGPVYARHLLVKDFIRDEARAFYDAHMRGRKILGVHFRGGDMIGAPQHPIPPSPAQMVATVREFLENHEVDRIFLATEVYEYTRLFLKFFPGKVLMADEFRGTNSINHYRIAYPRENHRYLLGKEAIVTTLLLSRADCLIAGGEGDIASGSNISRTAQILNGGKYAAWRMIYNGMYP